MTASVSKMVVATGEGYTTIRDSTDFSAIHDEAHTPKEWDPELDHPLMLSLIHISEPTRPY